MHTETCGFSSSYYCSGSGYSEAGSKGTTTITYGNLGVKGTLASGDAFDCDVDGDGKYDPDIERFYYVSDLKGDSDYAVLVYYNNTTAGSADNTSSNLISYDSNNTNYNGPITAVTNLPTTAQWKNVSLSNPIRAIMTETNATSTAGGTLPNNFDYSKYAARLLTIEEVISACKLTIDSREEGELEKCEYLLENTKFSKYAMGALGYWLETPDNNNGSNAWNLNGNYRYIDTTYSSDTSYYGVRPVIEVNKNDIEY